MEYFVMNSFVVESSLWDPSLRNHLLWNLCCDFVAEIVVVDPFCEIFVVESFVVESSLWKPLLWNL